MAPNGIIPNGTAEAPIEVSSVPSIVGINFGNSYASIAVLTKVRYFLLHPKKSCVDIFFDNRKALLSALLMRMGSVRSLVLLRFTERRWYVLAYFVLITPLTKFHLLSTSGTKQSIN